MSETRARDVRLRGCRVLVVDTETTGLGDDAQIVEVAAVVMDQGAVVEEVATLVNPGWPIPAAATEIHGITDAMVARAPSFEELAPRLHARIQAADVVVAYNAAYDAGRINAELRACDADWRIDPNTWLDPLVFARWRLPHLRSRRLGALAALLGVEAGMAHRALGDAQTTARVWPEMVGRHLISPFVEDALRHQAIIARKLDAEREQYGTWLYDQGLREGNPNAGMLHVACGEACGVALAEADAGLVRWMLDKARDRGPAGAVHALEAEVARRSTQVKMKWEAE